jgi:hypothetical protein
VNRPPVRSVLCMSSHNVPGFAVLSHAQRFAFKKKIKPAVSS